MKLMLVTIFSLCFLLSLPALSQINDIKAPAVFEGKLIKKPVSSEEGNKNDPEFKKGAKFTFTYRTSLDTKPTKDMREFLDKLSEWIKNNPNGNLRITGHSDQTGTGKEIQERSMERAKNVKEYLISKTNAKNIIVTGEGARHPIADIYSEMGKAQNRRVEIEIVSE